MNSSWNPLRSRIATLLAVILFSYICLSGAVGMAQSVPEPRREQLLNGLNILLWERPGNPDVLLKLRIHSGAAFDLAGKAGTMALLGDALFPDPTTREYITQELGGKIEVTTDYDAINVTLSGRAQDYERLVELLRAAIINLSLTADRVTELRDARAKMVGELSANPSTTADRTIAARLFGDYPYGRPYEGTTETLARVGRADVQYARERFLNANNSTLVVAGGVDRARAMRALRQLLGLWLKSDKIAPSTFRQPEAPDPRILVVDLPGTETAEVRMAVRGLGRSDRDYAAASVLALVARDRWQAAMPELRQSAFFVRHEPHVLPGSFVMGASVRTSEAARALATAQKTLNDLALTPPTTSEIERARSEAVASFNRQVEKPETLANLWLDAETYKLSSISDQARALGAVTPADVQRVAGRLLNVTPQLAPKPEAAAFPFVVVVVGDGAQLKTEFERDKRGVVMREFEAPPLPSKPGTGSATKKSP